MTVSNSSSGDSLQPERATAETSHPPAMSAVAQLITASNRVIADAHEHGRKAVTLKDVLIARLMFAIARRLARLAWSFAMRGKARVS